MITATIAIAHCVDATIPITLAFAADKRNLLRAASDAGGMPRFPQG